MKRIILCLLLFTLSFHACKKSNPVQADDKSSSLFSSSFEEQGRPSLKGWTFFTTLIDSQAVFSQDVPPGGGSYSLRLSYPGIQVVSMTIPLAHHDSLSYLILSYWAKGFGCFQAKFTSTVSGAIQNGPSRCVVAGAWTSFKDTLTLSRSDFDSLNVSLYRSQADTTFVVQFDEVYISDQLP